MRDIIKSQFNTTNFCGTQRKDFVCITTQHYYLSLSLFVSMPACLSEVKKEVENMVTRQQTSHGKWGTERAGADWMWTILSAILGKIGATSTGKIVFKFRLGSTQSCLPIMFRNQKFEYIFLGWSLVVKMMVLGRRQILLHSCGWRQSRLRQAGRPSFIYRIRSVKLYMLSSVLRNITHEIRWYA